MQSESDMPLLARSIKDWGRELGFSDVRIAGIDLPQAAARLKAWLDEERHGEMAYMAAHGEKRARPAELVPGAVRAITVRMDYLPQRTEAEWRERERARLEEGSAAQVSLYARGRDYHRTVRNRLQRLAEMIEQEAGPFVHRVFADSAPVMEVALAEEAGLGWRGKHNLLITRTGSMFFLGELLVGLPLPVDQPLAPHCGNCRACIDSCPTGAIDAPYSLDARRCISYLTIELKGEIPVELRPLIGNRIYGCDDCQLACPWNKFAQTSAVPDFDVRNGLDNSSLIELFDWSEEEFGRRLEGSSIRRIGHERWLRNIAVALGNALTGELDVEECVRIEAALGRRAHHPSALVRGHVEWALAQSTG